MGWASKASGKVREEKAFQAALASRQWSTQQDAFFDWYANPEGHFIGRARAGTGKTTTLLEGHRRAGVANALVCAFSKRIADELVVKLANLRVENVEAKTSHSIGFRLVRANARRVEVEKKAFHRQRTITDQVCGFADWETKRLVSKLHTFARETAPLAKTPGDLLPVAERFQILPERHSSVTVADLCSLAYQGMEWAANNHTVIDYADMLFLPIRHGWMEPVYDLITVDEAQDLTVAQLTLVEGVLNPGGHIAIIGDDRQAIFGFRGADTRSLDRLKAKLHAGERKLTTSYRCGKAIVEFAKKLVPDFEAGADNPDGEVIEATELSMRETVRPGAFILSRVNAPLASTAMALLRKQRRARIAGRDIGKQLITVLGIAARDAATVNGMLRNLGAWEDAQISRMLALGWEGQVGIVSDQADTIRALADDALQVSEVETRINHLFSDDTTNPDAWITCSTVHKAKGLEADQVFVLEDTFVFKGDEEANVRYVAYTRAKSSLVLVRG